MSQIAKRLQWISNLSKVKILSAALVIGLFLSIFICPIQGKQEKGHENFTVLCFHSVDNAINKSFEKDSILVRKLTDQFQWLKQNGYTVVSMQDLVDARDGKKPLPDRAVVLTFDDGYKSFYRLAFPLLKAFQYPAILAICGEWIDHPEHVDEKGIPNGEKYMSWAQIKEVSDSGLVEIGSHSYNLHQGILANPQGNKEPLAVTFVYNKVSGKYDSIETVKHRIRADLEKSSKVIAQHTGKRPRVMVWPYGRFGDLDMEISREVGMPYNMRLTNIKQNNIHNMSEIYRDYYAEDDGLDHLIGAVTRWDKTRPKSIRSIRIDLDEIYDPDPVKAEKNLSELLNRVHNYKITTVFLKGYVADRKSGVAKELYFPNRHLPMKADLMNRVVWQLRSRGRVDVFAWMPVTAYDFGRDDAHQKIKDIYEDLAIHVPIDGVAFYDAGVPTVLKDGSAGDYPSSAQEIKSNSQGSIQFTLELKRILDQYRGNVQSTRTLLVSPDTTSVDETRFAQNLGNYINSYDFVTIMAPPQMECDTEADRWIKEVAHKVKEHPKGLEKTLFELESIDRGSGGEPIDPNEMVEQMESLQLHGLLNFGYYPDSYKKNLPDAAIVRRGLSTQSTLYID